jgi:hypothetical protein
VDAVVDATGTVISLRSESAANLALRACERSVPIIIPVSIIAAGASPLKRKAYKIDGFFVLARFEANHLELLIILD